MKALAITHGGLEQVSAGEIREILGKNAKSITTGESVILFDAKEHLDLCTLCYTAQSVSRVLLLRKSLEFKSKEEIFSAAKGIDFSDFITEGKSFRVTCRREGEHDFTSSEIEDGIGRHIRGRVNLDRPDIIIYAYICGRRCYIGVDFSGFDLSKRHYRIFNYRSQLKATLAYCLLRAAGYRREKTIVDPFCGSGTILIEAALYACRLPVNYYNKERFSFLNFKCIEGADFSEFFSSIDRKAELTAGTSIHGLESSAGYARAAQNNARIAIVDRKISITRAGPDWLDTRLKRESADIIATYPPQITEREKKDAEKAHKELFHQSEYVLKRGGIMALVCDTEKTSDSIMRNAEERRFRLKTTIQTAQGRKPLMILLLEKQSIG